MNTWPNKETTIPLASAQRDFIPNFTSKQSTEDLILPFFPPL